MAAGQFASVEEAVRFAVDHLVLTDAALGDLSWVKPYLDEARSSIARGEIHFTRGRIRRNRCLARKTRRLMAQVVLSLQARLDLLSIPARERRRHELQTDNRKSQYIPGTGTPRSQLGSETRVASVEPYLIFYDGGPQSEVVHVLRILHGHRNITPEADRARPAPLTGRRSSRRRAWGAGPPCLTETETFSLRRAPVRPTPWQRRPGRAAL